MVAKSLVLFELLQDPEALIYYLLFSPAGHHGHLLVEKLHHHRVVLPRFLRDVIQEELLIQLRPQHLVVLVVGGAAPSDTTVQTLQAIVPEKDILIVKGVESACTAY